MAGDEEKKKKKSTSSSGDKDKTKDAVKKEKKDDKKVKDGSKDKSSSSGDKAKTKDKSSSSKEKDPVKKEAKENKTSSSKDKAASSSKKQDKLAAPAPRGPKRELPPKSDDYMAMMNLPSSDESDVEVEKRRVDEDEVVQLNLVSTKDNKKLDAKERKLLEKQAAAKADALRDDDNVFDVSYEKQGEGTDTLSATDIKVHNMTIRAKGKLLLENTTVTIAAGRRYGLVGPNGKGKSTLLRMIARRQIPVPENLDVLLVEQEIVGDSRTALEAVVAADFELMELRQREAELTAKLQEVTLEDQDTNEAAPANGAADDDDEDVAEQLNQVYDRMAQIGGASAEARASKILHGLGFTDKMQSRATQDFSGGWRMRISLARALYIQPTVLLLDEPTNHLDLRAVLWLEEYLQRWKKTLIVVSHDRDFLNSITTDIIHLHDLKLHYYRGNFVQFEEMYEQRRRQVNTEFEKYQKQLKAAKKTGSKAKADNVVAAAKKQKGKKGGKDMNNEDDEGHTEVPKAWSDYQVKFHFPTPTELPPPLIQLIDVDFKYPGREDFGLKGLNIGVDMGSRIAIVGPNGAGKTTLMNLLSGFLDPSTGEFRKSHKLRIGKYAQHFVDALAMEDTPVEYMMNKFRESGKRPEEFRAILGRFGLSGHHHLQPICKLSGGQKARVVFASLSLEQPHILLLDEPTNHLDMQSIDALADALEEFDGGVIIISHDSRLLSRVCDDEEHAEVWLVEDGEVERYPGDFEDYKDELMKEIAAELDEDEAEIAAKNNAAAKTAAGSRKK